MSTFAVWKTSGSTMTIMIDSTFISGTNSSGLSIRIGITLLPRWAKLTVKWCESDFIRLYRTQATVLLSANVGFLAIQSIDMTGPDRSVAQIGSYISTSFSLATYVIFQILARQHRPIARRKGFFFDTGEEVCWFVIRPTYLLWDFVDQELSEETSVRFRTRISRSSIQRSYRVLYMEVTFYSIFVSFSYSSLSSLSMLTFLLAVSFMFFFHTSTATRYVTGVIYAFMVVLSGVVVYMDWGSHPWDYGA